MLYVAFQGIYKLGLTLLVPVDITVSFIGLSFYYLSKHKGYFVQLRLPLLIIMFGACAFFWFQLGGYFGPATIGAILVGTSAIVLSPSKQKVPYFLFSILFVLLLVFLQRNTDWTRSIQETITTLHINYVLFAFATLLIIFYVKREFDKERRNSEKQNIRLSALNKLLNNTIQEKEKIIEKLKDTRDQLIDAEKMASIGRFTAGIAHELNNPLNFVGGSVRPIKQDLNELFEKLTEEQKAENKENIQEINNLLDNIRNGTQQAQQVMDSLLQISPKSKIINKEAINLSELLVNVSKFFERSAIDITFLLKIEPELFVVGHLVEINQVLVNLIKNSIDAVSLLTSKKIEIALTKQNDFAVISIRDNGSGISEKDLPHIFEPFYTTKPPGVGTGVGLYISFTIARKHGGDLQHEPTSEGTLFLFKIPLLQKVDFSG